MKLPKPDLSKEGLKSFFFHHIEKVILGVSAILLGVFFWLGFKTESFTGSTPQQLVDAAQRANDRMTDDGNWNKIAEFRVANTTADEICAQPVDIDPDKFELGYFRGTRAKTAELRGDPQLWPVEGLMAVNLPVNVLMLDPASSNPYTRLKTARAVLAAQAEDDEEPDERGGFGTGGGLADGGEEPQSESRTRSRKNEIVELQPGTEVPQYIIDEMPWARTDVATGGQRTETYNANLVTGIVRFKNQFADYDKTFKQARGYWPLRDRPIYKLVEIQRRTVTTENGEDVPSEWKDVTGIINELQPTIWVSGPEIVDAPNYDPVLTQRLPSVFGADYSRYFSWPLPGATVPDDLKADLISQRNVLAREAVQEVEESEEDALGGSRRNDEFGRTGGTNNQRAGASSLDDEVERLGSDRSAYIKEQKRFRQPKEDVYKLVRFFDLLTEPGTRYQYRIRLWLLDPNNQSPDSSIYQTGVADNQAGENNRSFGTGGGLVDDEGNAARGGNTDDEEEINFVEVAINDVMLRSPVRQRLRSGEREFPAKYDSEINGTYEEELRYARPTSWSEIVDVSAPVVPDAVAKMTIDPSVTIHAGGITVPRQTRINDVFIDVGEPVVKVAASRIDDEFDTRVPLLKDVRVADYLNLKGNAHIIDPVSMAVYYLQNYESRMETMVVDIMGGEQVKSLGGGRDAEAFSLPGEILVMLPNGELAVSNTLDDLGNFKRDLLLDDDPGADETEESAGQDDDEDAFGGRGRGGRGGRGDDGF